MLSLLKKILKPAGTGRSNCSLQAQLQTAFREMGLYRTGQLLAAWSLQSASVCCATAVVCGAAEVWVFRPFIFFFLLEKEKRECQAIVDGLRDTLDVRNATIESLQKVLGETEMLCSSLKVPFPSVAGLWLYPLHNQC